MRDFKKSFAAVLVIVVLSAPALAQGHSGNAPPTQNVNVVNNPTVQASDLYPARPFQKTLVPHPVDVLGTIQDCTTVPAGGGLIIELVTARARRNGPLNFLIMELLTTAGGEIVRHIIPLEKVETNPNFDAVFAVTQPLRAYADPGTQLCLEVVNVTGPSLSSVATISGQLAPAAPTPAAPAQ